MTALIRNDLPGVVTNVAQHDIERYNAANNSDFRPGDVVPRVYFTCEGDVKEFSLKLEDYLWFNNIPDKNKYLMLKCSLKN